MVPFCGVTYAEELHLVPLHLIVGYKNGIISSPFLWLLAKTFRLLKYENLRSNVKFVILADGEGGEEGGTGFTVLGEDLSKGKGKVRRVLPHWLANPDVVSVDLTDQQVWSLQTFILSRFTNWLCPCISVLLRSGIRICHLARPWRSSLIPQPYLSEKRSYWLVHQWYSVSKKLQWPYLGQQVSVGDLGGLDEVLLKNLKSNGVTHFFPVQRQIIPYMLANKAGSMVGDGLSSNETQGIWENTSTWQQRTMLSPVEFSICKAQNIFRTFSQPCIKI